MIGLTLPTCSLAVVGAWNALASSELAALGDAPQAAVAAVPVWPTSLHLDAAGSPPAPTACARLGEGRVWLHHAGWQSLHMSSSHGWPSMDTELEAAVHKAVHQQASAWLHDLLGTEIRFEASPLDNATAAAGTIRWTASSVPTDAMAVASCWLLADERAWDHIRQAAQQHASAVKRDLPVLLRILLPSTRLSKSELADLEPGDFMPVTTQRSADAGSTLAVQLAIGKRTVARGTLKGSRIESVLLVSPTPTGDAMNDTQGLKRLDDLEVNVSFQVGSITASLHELQTLKADHVFVLPTAPNAANVQILVDGQRLGTGRLLEVNGMLGVQVTHWI
jgi:type III secretion system YscQ/HrcQ family protein